MANKNLVVRLVLIILCLAFTVGIINLLISIENEKMDLQSELQKLAISKQGLASVVAYLETDNENLINKMKQIEVKVDNLNEQFSEEKEMRAKTEEKLKEKELALKYAEDNIVEYKKEKQGMLRSMKLLNSAFSEIKIEYDDVAKAKEQKEREIEELDRLIRDLSKQDSTSLGTVVIR